MTSMKSMQPSLFRALRFHAALFVVAVVAAILTWNRDIVPADERARPLAWQRDTTEVVSVRLVHPEIDMEIQRRVDDRGDFLWGTQVTGATLADTLEFPAGAPAHTLVGRLAGLRVIRELGPLSPVMQTEFGLDEPWGTLTVNFGDEERTLLLGDSTFASTDRYAADQATWSGYVVPGDVVSPLRIGQGALRERWLHRFQSDEVSRVRLSGRAGERLMTLGESGAWSPGSGGDVDEAFANFMQRVDQLAIAGYGDTPLPDMLSSIMMLEYLDADGNNLGFVELLRETDPGDQPYFIRSETTRVVARAVRTLAERVEQGLEALF